MTSFILRILFSGLMVFVPNEDGTEVTVLLLNVDHGYHTSDGLQMPHHKPLLLARAGSCTGQCPTRDSEIAQYIYRDQTASVRLDSIEEALTSAGGGGGWVLSNSELSVQKGSSSAPNLPALVIQKNVRGTSNGVPLAIPTSSAEREDFSWVANLKELCPSCNVDPAVLATDPNDLVVARFRLRSGKVFTYTVARITDKVTPVNFKRLDGTGNAASYSQAVASWVAADINISGTDVQIVEDKFDGGTGRSMKLTPDANGKVEVAVLNLPPFVPPSSPDNNAPEVGKHFQLFYDIAQNAPTQPARFVPRAGALPGATIPNVDWTDVHPQTAVASELLNKLRLDVGRTVYERVLCPPSQDPLP
jgi:hypothetical protein